MPNSEEVQSICPDTALVKVYLDFPSRRGTCLKTERSFSYDEIKNLLMNLPFPRTISPGVLSVHKDTPMNRGEILKSVTQGYTTHFSGGSQHLRNIGRHQNDAGLSPFTKKVNVPGDILTTVGPKQTGFVPSTFLVPGEEEGFSCLKGWETGKRRLDEVVQFLSL